MSAHFDAEVKRHLDEMHRQYLAFEAAELPARTGTRVIGMDESHLFGGGEVGNEFEQEEIIQPRRLSLRVF